MLAIKLITSEPSGFPFAFSTSPDGDVLPIEVCPTKTRDDLYSLASAQDQMQILRFKPVPQKSQLFCRRAIADRETAIYIYRGMLESDVDGSVQTEGEDRPIPVVCKIALSRNSNFGHMDDLRHEAQFYVDHLEHFQGKEVPLFYGLFQKGNKIMCTVLQDCGDPYTQAELCDEVPLKTKRVIIQNLLALHSAGIYHKQITEHPHHIVMSSGINDSPYPRIIDFQYATPTHPGKCAIDERKLKNVDELRLGNWQLRFDDVPCTEIILLCQGLKVWIPKSFMFNGYSVPSYRMKTPEKFLEYLTTRGLLRGEEDADRAKDLCAYFHARYGENLKQFGWPIEKDSKPEKEDSGERKDKDGLNTTETLTTSEVEGSVSNLRITN